MPAIRWSRPSIYDKAGADELCFLDIGASVEQRDIMLDVVARTAERCFMPLTVGGGVRSLEDIRRLLLAGADKVSINSAAHGRSRSGAPRGGEIRQPMRDGGHRREGDIARDNGPSSAMADEKIPASMRSPGRGR